MAAPIATILLILASLVAFILLMIFVMVPLFKGIAYLIGWTVGGIAWLFKHVFEFVFGTIGDVIRFVGGIPVFVIFSLLAVLNVAIGRWSAAGHFASSAKRECRIGTACLYRAFIRRPLRFVLLDGMLEGFEQRLPEAMAASPGADKPRRRTGQFEGYEIVGSLPGGGSGGKLYVARPDASTRSNHPAMPELVVIKSFALTEGSSLPQIVRESRALECAKQLGHVLEHQMDEHRFYYVMPYHDGDHLGIITRQLHAEAGPKGLGRRQLIDVMSYVGDLLYTLSAYHRGGLWHKDVKPDNVIVHDGRAHLVDLGLVTPLRSAMTLTTHGTEYFRDPEMVRQALRGVKVHQVDGAKFDIYAVGAVLYFLLENTFPAHGGLSRFSKESPEALRWIVRRSMADYNQRYTAADIMLADLRAAMTARDPFAVRPVDLPSMRGADAPAAEVVAAVDDGVERDPQVAAVYAAHTPKPPPPRAEKQEDAEIRGYGVAVGPGGVRVGRLGGKSGAGGGKTARGRRPKLQVTNWWTGAYRVDDPATSQYTGPEAAQQAQHHDLRDEARAFRRQAAHLRQQVAVGAMSARRAAKEQIRSARARARQVQRKAHTRGARAGVPSAPNQPSIFLGFLVVTVLAVGALAAITVFKTRAPQAFSYIAMNGSGDPVHRMMIGENRGLPALIVADEADLSDPDVERRLLRLAQKHEHDGYDVIIEPDADHEQIGEWIRTWRKTRNKKSDTILEDFMEANDLYAFIHVTGEGRNLRDLVIRSTRAGARDRRRTFVDVPAVAPERPYLLINDHPAKVDPAVEKRVTEIIDEHRKHGWEVVLNDEVEAEVRRLLPTGPNDPNTPPPAMLHQILGKHELGGLLFIDARAGEGSAHDRITVTRIAAEPATPAAPEAPPNSTG